MEVSSPDKLLFPADGIAKLDVVDHYRSVGERMLGFAAGRPLTLERFPRGIEAPGFMQKNAADHFPGSIGRHRVPRRSGGETVYPVVDEAEDLAWLANQNTITFHMWTSTIERPWQPDWMVIDLDPEAGDVVGVRTALRLVAEILGSFAISGFPVATGSKGFHLWVPLDGSLAFEHVSLVARAVAGLAVTHAPTAVTTEFLKENREGRVFIDWLRNQPIATVVVPFSLRSRPGAPVAVPITWDELDDAEPDGWHIGKIDDRFAIDTELEPQSLPVAEIEAAARNAGVDLDTPHDRFGRRA